MFWGRSLSWVWHYWVGQRWTRFPFLYWPLYLSHVYRYYNHRLLPLVTLCFFNLSLWSIRSPSSTRRIVNFAYHLARSCQYPIQYVQVKSYFVGKFISPIQNWIHADHISFLPLTSTQLYCLAISSHHTHVHTFHIYRQHTRVRQAFLDGFRGGLRELGLVRQIGSVPDLGLPCII
jgi:hypothetical protein